jgi:UDP:flavonoid glycosyltransferase YjiC (YdhE family)
VVVATWAAGGNLPPLLSLARVLSARGRDVRVLTSPATQGAAAAVGLDTIAYQRSPEPDMTVPYELQADEIGTIAAGSAIAAEAYDWLRELQPQVLVADCMLPAALAAAQASSTRAVSVIHFMYGTARRQIEGGSGWTTNLRQLDRTRTMLGLGRLAHPLDAWESYDLVLVTAPRWFDRDARFPPNVVHAGPLGVRTRRPAGDTAREDPGERPRALISFSTTAMDGQARAIQAVCTACDALDLVANLTLGPAVDARGLRLPDNVQAVPFADHDDILPTCQIVVSHAGLGTTLRSLAHGVPHLMLPLGRDQHGNAQRVADLGAGTVLTADSPPAQIEAALHALLHDDRFRQAAVEAADKIAVARPDRRAADAVGQLLIRS